MLVFDVKIPASETSLKRKYQTENVIHGTRIDLYQANRSGSPLYDQSNGALHLTTSLSLSFW